MEAYFEASDLRYAVFSGKNQISGVLMKKTRTPGQLQPSGHNLVSNWLPSHDAPCYDMC